MLEPDSVEGASDEDLTQLASVTGKPDAHFVRDFASYAARSSDDSVVCDLADAKLGCGHRRTIIVDVIADPHSTRPRHSQLRTWRAGLASCSSDSRNGIHLRIQARRNGPTGSGGRNSRTSKRR